MPAPIARLSLPVDPIETARLSRIPASPPSPLMLLPSSNDMPMTRRPPTAPRPLAGCPRSPLPLQLTAHDPPLCAVFACPRHARGRRAINRWASRSAYFAAAFALQSRPLSPSSATPKALTSYARRVTINKKFERGREGLEERALGFRGLLFAEVLVGFLGRDATAGRATEIALLEQVGLVDVFDGVAGFG